MYMWYTKAYTRGICSDRAHDIDDKYDCSQRRCTDVEDDQAMNNKHTATTRYHHYNDNHGYTNDDPYMIINNVAIATVIIAIITTKVTFNGNEVMR